MLANGRGASPYEMRHYGRLASLVAQVFSRGERHNGITTLSKEVSG